jgi:hypothetical protein
MGNGITIRSCRNSSGSCRLKTDSTKSNPARFSHKRHLTQVQGKVRRVVTHAGKSQHSGGWGWRISWVQEFKTSLGSKVRPRSKRKKEHKKVRLQKGRKGPGVVVHTCNPSSWEAEARGLRVQGQPGWHSEFKAKASLNYIPRSCCQKKKI